MLIAIAVFSSAHAFLLEPPPASRRNLTIKATGCVKLEEEISSTSPSALFLSSAAEPNAYNNDEKHTNNTTGPEEEKDTIRVRIWRALASGDELSMTQLCKQVGESRGDVRSHLTHVERQARTIRNKSDDWRVRRGLAPLTDNTGDDTGSLPNPKKLRLKKRKGPKNEVFIRLV